MQRSVLARRLLTALTKPRASPLAQYAVSSAKPLPRVARYRSFSGTSKQRQQSREQVTRKVPDLDTTQRFDDWLSGVVASSTEVAETSGNFPGKLLGELSVHVLNLRRGGTTIGVKIERHERGNALNSKMLNDLKYIFDSIANQKTINGVCLLPSAGKTFCGGADTLEMSNLKGSDDAEAFIRKISDVCNSIRNIPVPVVALIQGSCIGAGLEIAASCDIRVCTKLGSFSMPEVLVQLPSVVQARLLCDIVGWGRARHLMFTGSPWNAQEARQAGLVTKVFSTREAMMAWATEYMAQLNDPSVRNQYRAQKEMINGWENQTVDEGIEAGVRCFADHFSQPALGKSIAMARAYLKHKRLASDESRSPQGGDSSQAESAREHGSDSPKQVDYEIKT